LDGIVTENDVRGFAIAIGNLERNESGAVGDHDGLDAFVVGQNVSRDSGSVAGLAEIGGLDFVLGSAGVRRGKESEKAGKDQEKSRKSEHEPSPRKTRERRDDRAT